MQQPIVYELLRRWLYGPQHSLYTNGVLAYTGSATGPIGDASPAMNDLRIATRQAGGAFWTGHIDEVRIWNITRTLARIAGDYRRRLLGTEPGLAAYLRLD